MFLALVHVLVVLVLTHPSPEHVNADDLLLAIPALVAQSPHDTVQLVETMAREGKLSNDECHEILHAVGHAAYRAFDGDVEQLLRAAGTVCLGGYLHGVEAEMLEHADARNILFALCESMQESQLTNGPCFHGTGHAALEREGDVAAALRVCETLAGGPEDDLSGCYRGVFSELSHTMAHSGSTADPFSYCATSKNARSACYSQMPQRYDRGQGFSDALARCLRAAPDAEAEEACAFTLTALLARKAFDTSDIGTIQIAIDEVSPPLLGAALRGVLDSYRGSVNVRDLPSWSTLCARFERVECEQLFSER